MTNTGKMTPQQIGRTNLEAIKILKAGNTENLSEEQRQILLQFTGWGACANIFNSDKTGWEKSARQELEELLTKEEYQEAFASTPNAHYTTASVIKAMWEGLRCLGLSGKINALEPGCGIGRFIEYAPPELDISWVGVERDIIPAKIAEVLHPSARIINQKFQHFQVQGSFDLVIGNVPFGDAIIGELYIHNYFLKRSVDLVREGGFVAVITSTGTLDSPGNANFRNLLAQNVDMVGAMRLPSNTFEAENTQVTTDILVFKKVSPRSNRAARNRTWLISKRLRELGTASRCKAALEKSLPFDGGREGNMWEFRVSRGIENLEPSREVLDLDLNGHYLYYPDRLLGRLSACTLYGSSRMALSSDNRDLPEAIVETFDSFHGVYEPAEESEQISITRTEVLAIPVGQFFWNKKELCQREEFGFKVVPPNLIERVSAMIELDQVLNQVIEAQKFEDEEHLRGWRTNLNTYYAKWFEKFGFLNAKQNIKVLGSDPRYYLLMALEKPSGKSTTLNKSKQKVQNTAFEKAEIFVRRTASPKYKPTFAKSIEDAIIYSLNEFGRINVEYIAGLRGKTELEITDELAKGLLAFFDPTIERWVIAEEYLSGNVREKLTAAIEAGIIKNIEALKAKQPPYLLPQTTGAIRAEIGFKIGEDLCNFDMDAYYQVKLGCTWIDPSIYGDFATFMLNGHKVEVTYDQPPIAAFGLIYGNEAALSVENDKLWGTPDFSFLQLLEKALGQKDPIVKKDEDEDDPIARAEAGTENARAKTAEIKEAFQKWLWEDLDRAIEITKNYNHKFNCYALREYNGEFLELPGCNPDFKWRPHQKNAIWRGITSPSTLLAHCVGAGKTAVMIAIIMEMRRLGLAKKPMLAVLPATLPSVVSEFHRLYPHAKLKIAFEKTLDPQNRKRFCTEIATGDWDCVIITHPQFTRGIALSPEATLKFLQEEKQLAEDALKVFNKEGKKESVKRAAKTIDRIDDQIAAAISAATELQDKVIYLEQTGIDALFFDESQVLKNLPYHTRRTENIAGLSNKPFYGKKNGAKITSRAFDAYMKIRWLQAHDRPVIFATGTPVSNSLAEAWTMMRYLAMPMLKKAGIEHFDACLAAFFNISSAMEQTPTGYKFRARCRGIDNIQEFMTLWKTFVDIQSATMLKLPVPNHKIIPVNCKSSDDQLRYMDHLIQRLNTLSLSRGRQFEKGQDNTLVVYGDARRGLGIDLRLLWAEAEDYVGSKLNACAMNVYRLWELGKSVKATQAIFFDFTSPNGGGFFDPYNGTKDALVALGIPAEEIAFIHDYSSAEERKKLYAQVNAGEIRVVMGSTETLGTGVNIQRLLVAIHQMVCPWRPSDIEQQMGRILRQQNLFEDVLIFRYVTEGKGNKPGFDSYVWGVILTKLESFHCLMSGEFTGRSTEDLNPFVASAATMMAIASGDPRIKDQIDLAQEIKSLSIQKRGFEENQSRITLSIQKTNREIHQLSEAIPKIKRDLAKAKAAKSVDVTIGKKTYTPNKKEKMAEILLDLRDEALEAKGKPSAAAKFASPVGQFAGFNLHIDLSYSDTRLYLVGEEWHHLYYSNKDAIYEYLTLEKIREVIKEELQESENKLVKAQKNLNTLTNTPKTEFSGSEKLAELIAKKADLDEQLNPANQAPSADETTTSSESESENDEDEDDNFVPFGDAKSPCIYTGVDKDIIKELRVMLKTETPDWVKDAIASFDVVAQKLQLEQTFKLSVEQPAVATQDEEDDTIELPDEFWSDFDCSDDDNQSAPEDFWDGFDFNEDDDENTDSPASDDFWDGFDYEEEAISDEIYV